METKKENNKFLFLKIIGVALILGVMGYFADKDFSNNTTSTASSTTLSNTETCKQYAQKEADSDGVATNQYYSVQSYNYSNSDKACYYELHYQMIVNVQGNKYVSQVYELKAVSKDDMENNLKYGVVLYGSREAECNVPETYYQGATTDCEYYGLELKTNSDGSIHIYQKYNLNNTPPPMSYSDYKALIQKRMSK